MSKILKSLVLAWSFFAFASGSALADGQGVVTQSSGNVLIVRGTQEIPATAGTAVRAGDVLKTSDGGTADISLNGLAGARILETSEVSVDDIATGSMRLAIRSGNAIMNLEKLPATSKFSVETPTAVASVRGTQFWGRVGASTGEPVTTFAVREGVVEILAKTSSSVFTLQKGQALDIPLGSPIVPSVRPALDDEMRAMAQADAIRTSA
jgi:hypothetical protein